MGDSIDAIIEIYKRDVDRTLIRENLRLSPEERLQRMEAALRLVDELRAGVERERTRRRLRNRRIAAWIRTCHI